MDFLVNWLQDIYSWYSMSFVIFLFIVVKFSAPVINAALDKRVADIKKSLEEAESLRVEAQEMLAQYQRKYRDAEIESQKIVEVAKENAQAFRKKSEAEMAKLIKRREEQLEDRLKRMEQNAISEIQKYAAELAMNAANQIILKNLNDNTKNRLVKESIQNIESNIVH